jgi:IS30 family transposase
VLSAQLQYLSELNDSMRKQFAESREQEIKSRQLAKLLNEEEATVEEVRREMADKY